MKFAKIALMTLIVICAAPQLVSPASGWYWPIFGFSCGSCPNIIGGPTLPPPYNAMTPGTFQWGYPPIGRAEMALPGCAYGPTASHGNIYMGMTPPFGSMKVSYVLPVSETATETSESATSEHGNRTMEGSSGSSTGLQGWLKFR